MGICPFCRPKKSLSNGLLHWASVQIHSAAVDAFRRTLWSQFEAETEPTPFVLGDTPSALDLYVAAFSHWRPRRAWIAQHCPNLHAIARRADTLPQLRDVLARNFG